MSPELPAEMEQAHNSYLSNRTPEKIVSLDNSSRRKDRGSSLRRYDHPEIIDRASSRKGSLRNIFGSFLV